MALRTRAAGAAEDVMQGIRAMIGTIASGVADDASEPVKVGAVYRSTKPTYVDGQRTELQADTRGAIGMTLRGVDGVAGATVTSAASVLDALAPGNSLETVSRGYLFDGVDWQRVRGNEPITCLASAARTASVNSATLLNRNARGLHLTIDVTAIAATPQITVVIEGRDELSGQWYPILSSVGITIVSVTQLKVYPGLVAAANLVANDVLPRTWRVRVTNLDADSITYSIGASLIL